MTERHYPERSPAAEAYIRRIRNKAKQAYARCWYTYCLGLNQAYPERATFAPLGVMGAQAVRLALADLGIHAPGDDGPAGSNKEDI